MPFSVTPVSDPFPTPLVAESQSATDRRQAREEANRRRPQHPHAEVTADEAAATPAEPEAVPPIGTLIDVRA